MYLQKNKNFDNTPLFATILDSPLGALFALADSKRLYYLEFTSASSTDLQTMYPFLRFEKNSVLDLLEHELHDYFHGNLTTFKTPLIFSGTDFQKKVWQHLQQIPYGTTASYKELACAVGNSSAFRAAANANGKNNFVILVPCHRVINSDGSLGGYNSGLEKKKWLLNHEKTLLNRTKSPFALNMFFLL